MAHRLHSKAVGTSKSSSTRPARRATALVALALGICVLAPALASAATLTDADELGRFGSEGSGAGQFKFLGSSAADPVTGHLYVADPVSPTTTASTSSPPGANSSRPSVGTSPPER